MCDKVQHSYTLSEVRALLKEEGYSQYLIGRAIDRLKLLHEITVTVDPRDERVKRMDADALERVRRYLQAGR